MASGYAGMVHEKWPMPIWTMNMDWPCHG